MQNVITLKKSPIQGKGVFAKKNFKKGEIVIRWKKSRFLTSDEVKKLRSSEKKYVSYYKRGKYILYGVPERYVNHSCNANTKTKSVADVAIREIHKGEEITANYVKEKVPGLNFRCKCKNSKCSGIINTNSK